jgi:hypothetical protein
MTVKKGPFARGPSRTLRRVRPRDDDVALRALSSPSRWFSARHFGLTHGASTTHASGGIVWKSHRFFKMSQTRQRNSAVRVTRRVAPSSTRRARVSRARPAFSRSPPVFLARTRTQKQKKYIRDVENVLKQAAQQRYVRARRSRPRRGVAANKTNRARFARPRSDVPASASSARPTTSASSS